jgi:hypothetical protein
MGAHIVPIGDYSFHYRHERISVQESSRDKERALYATSAQGIENWLCAFAKLIAGKQEREPLLRYVAADDGAEVISHEICVRLLLLIGGRSRVA